MFGPRLTIPGTLDWLNARLDLRGRRELRAILRRLERACDARLAVLWASETYAKNAVIEYSGDDAVMPPALPELASSIPSREVLRDRHGEQHDAVVHKIRLGGGVPILGAAIVVPGVEDPNELFDAIERAGAAVEGVLVEAVERAASR